MKGKPKLKKTVGANQKATLSGAMLHLKKVDPVLYKAALPHHEALTLNDAHRRGYRRTNLFAALAGSVVSQQLSTKAADSIWERLRLACGGAVTPEAIIRVRALSMRKAGLSNAKTKTLKELAKAIRDKKLDLLALRIVPEEEAIERLSAVWGIGPWTAEMFLMFALRREDVFSARDLGLIRAMEALYAIPKDSKREVYEAHAARWAPHRTFASRVLWRTRDTPVVDTAGA
ncbi:MAG: DNA-3-methyladenine glycosylase 2 family protein [Patescibacteria group bacterium]